MFSEKIDYERLRRLLLQNLEELHSEVYKIREEVSQIHQWNAVMFRFLYNQKFDEFEWKNSTQARIAVDNARNAIRENPDIENLQEHCGEIGRLMLDPSKIVQQGGSEFKERGPL